MSLPTSHDQLDLAVRPAAVQRPEVGPVAEPPQREVVAPDRLHDGLAGSAGQHVLGAVGGADDELRGVPRHVRVVPLQPGQRDAVGGQARVRDEVGATDQHGRRAVGLDADDLVDDVGRPVARRRASRGRRAAPSGRTRRSACRTPAAHRRLGGHRDRGVAPGVQPVQPLVGELGEPQRPAGDRPGAAAVLVHPRAGVPRRGQDVGDGAVGGAADDHRPAALGGP